MAAEPNAVEQAVSRTLRDNLGRIQRTAEELHQAVNDLVSACASSRPSNALPSMVRAQTSAAALSATLEVLSKFVTSALQTPAPLAFVPETLHIPSLITTVPSRHAADRGPGTDTEIVASTAVESVADTVAHAEHVDDFVTGDASHHARERVADHVVSDDATYDVTHDVVTYSQHQEPSSANPVEETQWTAPAPVEESPAASEIHSSVEPSPISDVQPPLIELPPVTDAVANFSPVAETVFVSEPVPEFVDEPVATDSGENANHFDKGPEIAPAEVEPAEPEPVEAAPVFSLDSLPPDEQELHRRAFRIAKVSMQDIKMLRPDDVRLGRENKDLCSRLRDDIEKAHKEYDRRFQSIQSHPVDYFYDWMVEILAGGDSQALGEYPYPTPALRR